MKKVRFEIQKSEVFGMSDSECHSPRPFIGQQMRTTLDEPCYELPRVLPYSIDPVHRFENSNSSPYPSVEKIRTSFPESEPSWKPSGDLDLSFLDASSHEPRQPFSKAPVASAIENRMCGLNTNNTVLKPKPVLSSTENTQTVPPNILVKDSSFFIRRDNLDKYMNINPLHQQFKTLGLGKENDPLVRKAEMVRNGIFQQLPVKKCIIEPPIKPIIKENRCQNEPKVSKSVVVDHCQCHHCIKTGVKNHPLLYNEEHSHNIAQKLGFNNPGHNHCQCTQQPKACTHCHTPPQPIQPITKTCDCQNYTPAPQNAVDKKTWAIEKYEERKQSECLEVEKKTNSLVSKEKREPTVADLFKIIKLQNEQLQMLQEKVDKFISQQNQPTITCSTEHVSSVENEQLKMSIGVMTSFEMVRTSTVINKEVVKNNENAQIQCNRSQISIKEVVAKPSTNFLDGIMPVNNPPDLNAVNDEKTLNELSLYNVQVDTTTPNLSPEQTLYLDVRDYSDSEASSNDQSNVGWTYYNKVMTHVNGMLQDSEMPSSASAMFRNMRHQCVQMQIDKSNISVTKRVKFGDDPLGIHQPHIYATDTSLKMNQLAAKYLKNSPQPQPQRIAKPTAPIDMSFATRNYMERHKIMQGGSKPTAAEIPRFLDITALKQQPKFL